MSKAAAAVQERAPGPQESEIGKRVLGVSTRLLIIAVLGVTFFAYAGTLGHQFVYDDRGQIIENPAIKSWSFAPGYFVSHVWTHKDGAGAGNYYRPVFMVWLLVNHTLFGLNAALWHLSTVAVHLAATLLVYLLARRLLKDEAAAAIAAMVFGLHPVHVESVAWVSGVTDPLLAVLLIPAFLFHLRWREEKAGGAEGVGAWKWQAWSVGMYVLAMLAKETAVALPVMIFVYEWVYGSRDGERRRASRRLAAGVKNAGWYVAATVAYLVVRTIVLKGLSHELTPLPLSTIVMTWPSLLWFYMKLLVWPVGLSAFYDTPYVSSASMREFVLPGAAVIVIAASLWLWSRRSKEVAFASALLLLPVLPLLNLSVFSPREIAHDRYLYIPSIGFSLIVALAVCRITSRAKPPRRPAIRVAAALVITSMLAVGTVSQSEHWASDLLLFYRGVLIAPNNDIAKNDLANQMFERQMYDEAIPLYKQVLDRNPNYWRSWYNLGACYFKQNRHKEAELCLNRALGYERLDADEVVRLALIRIELGQLDDAAASLRQAIKSTPDAKGYHYTLGTVLAKQGDLKGALDEFKSETVVNPDQIIARERMAEIEAALSPR